MTRQAYNNKTGLYPGAFLHIVVHGKIKVVSIERYENFGIDLLMLWSNSKRRRNFTEVMSEGTWDLVGETTTANINKALKASGLDKADSLHDINQIKCSRFRNT